MAFWPLTASFSHGRHFPLNFQSGVLTHQSKQYVIESLNLNNEETQRIVKRETSDKISSDGLVLIYQPLNGDKCGLKPQNMKRLLAPPWTDRVKILGKI